MVKKYLLMFVRRFYNDKLDYADTLIKEWVDALVKWMIDILFNGFVGYLAFFGLTFIFQALDKIIFLGNKYWHFPFAVILIGITSWFFRESWRWVQQNKKVVPPNIKVYQGR